MTVSDFVKQFFSVSYFLPQSVKVKSPPSSVILCSFVSPSLSSADVSVFSAVFLMVLNLNVPEAIEIVLSAFIPFFAFFKVAVKVPQLQLQNRYN